MKTTKYNYQSDLLLIERFYKIDESNEFIAERIPEDEVDFEFIYRCEDDRTFTAGRKKGIYINCRAISEFDIEVAIPLSRTNLGCGDLIHYLKLSTPNDFFPERVKQICIPAKTGYELWKGASQPLSVPILSPAALGSIFYGKSAYDLAKKYGYNGTEEEYATEPLRAAQEAQQVASGLKEIVNSATVDRIEASEDVNAGVGKHDNIVYFIFQ